MKLDLKTRVASRKKKTSGADTASYSAALSQLEHTSAPTYTPSYDDELDSLYRAILNREAFTYDASADPLYSQYREQYTQAGRRAMQDSTAQAAALTGGYGSTYAASAGQQQYDAYMQRLAEAIPELYQQAYARYTAEGDALNDRYSLVRNAADTEYSRYLDADSRYRSERDYLAGRADAEYKRAASEADDARSAVTDLIAVGYNPNDDELSEAGLTREQSNALLYEYYRSKKLSAPDWLKSALGISTKSSGSNTSKKQTDTEKAVSAMVSSGASAETVNGYIVRQVSAGAITAKQGRALLV